MGRRKDKTGIEGMEGRKRGREEREIRGRKHRKKKKEKKNGSKDPPLQRRGRRERNDEVHGRCARSLAAATAAAAGAASSGRGREGFWRAVGDGGAKDGKLERGFFAGTFGARDFLLLVEDEFFELGFAVVADVFVDGHETILAATKVR